MKPNNLTVFELFERQQRYVVPLFQRPYVWSKDKQWIPLWEDISAKAEEIINSQRYNHREPSNHFMGAIVLNPIKTSGLEVTAKSIIDGQQRLTTLQIILFALRDFMQANKNEELLQTIELHTENNCKKEHPVERYKVWPTNFDRPDFENIFSVGSPEKLKEIYTPAQQKSSRRPLTYPTLVSAYLYFYESIQAFVNVDNNDDGTFTKEDQTERLSALAEAFKRHLEIVTIDLDENDNPQTIFETLNFRGEPLLPSDLLRNFVFLEATRSKAKVEELYHEYWQEYDQIGTNLSPNFWKELEQQGRIKRQRMELFVFHYLVYRSGKDIFISQLYKDFRDWWEDEKPNVEEELACLKQHSRIFREFYQPDPGTRKGIFLGRLRRMDISTMYPLLLFLFSQDAQVLPEVELQGMLLDLESYVVRRMICGLTTKNYNNIFLTLLNTLRKEETLSRKTLSDLLLAYNSDSNRWPDDKLLEERWLTRDVYHGLGFRAKIVLEAINLQLKSNKQEDIPLPSNLTLEHLMPQGWQDTVYPLPPAVDEAERVRLKERRTMLMQTFGNLTLLTQALNAAISNGPFEAKLEEIRRHSLLRLNSELLKPHKAGHWTEEDIHTRGENLFKIASQIWPHP